MEEEENGSFGPTLSSIVTERFCTTQTSKTPPVQDEFIRWVHRNEKKTNK